MKISTNFFFDRASQQLTRAQNQVATTQAQLSTGKQLLRPSDSPDQAVAIDRLRTAVSRQESLSENLKTIYRRFESEETALRSATTVFERVKELSIQAANDTLGAKDREVIAIELASLRDQLQMLANTRDDQGQYIFAGTASGTMPYTQREGVLAYQGDQTATSLTTGQENLQTFNRAGTDVFTRVVRHTQEGPVGVPYFKAIEDLMVAIQTSDAANMQRGIAEMDDMHQSMAMATADVGARMNQVDMQIDLIDENVLRLKTTLSEVQDLDYTEAVTRMNKQMMALQASMSSFSKISQLSLFDYIR